MRLYFAWPFGVAFALFTQYVAAEESPPQVERNGTWLRSEIRQYEKFQNKEPQSLADASQAVAIIFYVRGVLDVQFALHTKATVQGLIIQGSQELKNPKQKLPQCDIDCLRTSNKFFVPLSQTEFFAANHSMDQYMQVIKNYLEKHPEKWARTADNIIEWAMLDAFPIAKQ
jgi:hypothetical protein